MDPATITAIAALGGTALNIFDRLATSDLRRIENEVFNQQISWHNDLQRRARGKFTDSELEQIKADSAAGVNQVAANVAARLGSSSPAGVQLISQAQQAPITAAMQTAQSQYGASLANLGAATNARLGAMAGDVSFVEDLQGVISGIAELRSLGVDVDSDPDLNLGLDEIIGGYGQGYISDPSKEGPHPKARYWDAKSGRYLLRGEGSGAAGPISRTM